MTSPFRMSVTRRVIGSWPVTPKPCKWESIREETIATDGHESNHL